jgi:DNA ligase-4
MIVLFDILLIDDKVCLRMSHRERRLLLKDTIRIIPGHSDIAEQEILDFSRADSQYRLESSFSKRITERWEGYVLKGCDEPYFTIFSTGENNSLCRWIKLKKDYIPGLGDTVDLAIIGGRYESRDAAAMKEVHKLSWTHFVVGCLVNKDAVLQIRAKPKFRVVDTINRYSMNRQNLQILNQFGEFSACNPESSHGFDIEYGQSNPTYMHSVFKTPFVVEMMGSGFEKPSGARYFTLRIPRAVKIHWDRTFVDAASFSELQLLAEAARSVPAEDMGLERFQWTKRLRLGDGSSQYIFDRSQDELSTASSYFEETSSETSSPAKRSIPSNRTTTLSCGEHGLYSRSDRADPAHPRNETSIASKSAIPIHIDHTETSSSEVLDGRNLLTENENLSQSHFFSLTGSPTKHRNTDANEENENINSANYTYKADISTPSAPEPKTKEKPPKAAFRTTTTPIQQPRLRSPLTTIPVYLHPSYLSKLSASTANPQRLSSTMKTTTDNLSSFLGTLSSQTELQTANIIQRNPHTPSQRTAYGLVCLDSTKAALGAEILRVGRALDTVFDNEKAQAGSLPLNTKIFFLDAAFLGLQTTSADRRFCRRTTWEAIAREYFCACLRWSTDGAFVGFDKRELASLAEVGCFGG